MNRWITYLLIVLCLGCMDFAKAAGEKYQITLLLSPTAEWVYFRATPSAEFYNDAFGSKLSYNFGLEYKHFFDPSLSISTGLIYQNKGFRNEYTLTNLDGSKQDAVTLGSAHFATLPIYLNAHHKLARKVEMIYTAGLGFGYKLSETVRNRNWSGEEDPADGLFNTGNGRSNSNLWNDFYLGLHVGVGISAYLKSRIVMVVQPMYKYQLNDAHNRAAGFNDFFAAKLNSFGVDVKVGYFFNKQINNRNKRM